MIRFDEALTAAIGLESQKKRPENSTAAAEVLVFLISLTCQNKNECRKGQNLYKDHISTQHLYLYSLSIADHYQWI